MRAEIRPRDRGVLFSEEWNLNGEIAWDDALEDQVSGHAEIAAWTDRGRALPLGRWLDRVLDPEGTPRSLPVGDWGRLLKELGEARQRGGGGEGWPEPVDARIEGLLRATLRFARPDGSASFAPHGARPDMLEVFRGWAERLSDPGLLTVLNRWSRRVPPVRDDAPPPSPAWSSPLGPLAILRAGWAKQGEFLAIDHRKRGVESLVELAGLGKTWLGPIWASDLGYEDARASAPRPSSWVSTPSADLAEWTFRRGKARVTRTALLLHGRRIALLADQIDGPGDRAGMRIDLPEGVEATAPSSSNGRVMGLYRGRSSARVIPIGLSCREGSPERGKFAVEGRQLHLGMDQEGRRRWLPLLVSWDPLRDRKTVTWRVLSVAENSRNCPAETAFAARVSWGRGETLLIYRSLARPAIRSFLGHQTRARFLVALFTREGEIEPILKVE